MADQTNYDEVIKLGVPVGVSTLSIMGIPLSEMVYMLTMVYILINIGCTLYRTYKQTRKGD